MLRLVLVLILFLCGCNCPHFMHRMDGQIHFEQQTAELYDLYHAHDVERLERLLMADSWLLKQHQACYLLTYQESQVLQERIRLIRSMINIIRAVD